jgi:hypothetical protein
MNKKLIEQIANLIFKLFDLIAGKKKEVKVEITETTNKPEAVNDKKNISDGNTDAFADKHGIELPDKLPK